MFEEELDVGMSKIQDGAQKERARKREPLNCQPTSL